MRKITFILALVMSMLSFTNAKADKLLIGNAESDITCYSNNYESLVYDGKYNTKFWSSGSPQAGYTFTVYLNSSANVGDIKLYFSSGDLPTDGALIEVKDNGSWVQVGEPLNGVKANDVVTRNAGGIYTNEIRLRFTQESKYWFQLVEFEVYEYERTVSAVASPAEGGTVMVNGTSGEVTAKGDITLSAVPAYGYKFVNWTLGGEEVSTSAEYTDNTDGDKEYVAHFEKFTSVDDWYASIDKPTFAVAGSTTAVVMVELDGVNASGFTYTPGTTTSLMHEALKVTPGKTYSLNVTYDMKWGDIALFQIDRDGAEKKYGYYTCALEAYANPLTVLERDNSEFMCEEFGVEEFSELVAEDTYLTLPYEITISENAQSGDVVVLRAIIGKKNATNPDNNTAYEKNVVEGGCLDIVCVVAEPEQPEDTSVWSTSYAPYPVNIPDGVNSYIVTAAASDYVTLTRFEGVIPANTAVILNDGEPKGEAVDVDFGTNLLKGTVVDTYLNEEAYVLSKVDGVVGFYKAKMTDGVWLNNATKAYLPVSAVSAVAQGAASFSFRFGESTTGIDEITDNREQGTVIFDLSGRRIENITAPGIYIVNGKKLLVK